MTKCKICDKKATFRCFECKKINYCCKRHQDSDLISHYKNNCIFRPCPNILEMFNNQEEIGKINLSPNVSPPFGG